MSFYSRLFAEERQINVDIIVYHEIVAISLNLLLTFASNF